MQPVLTVTLNPALDITTAVAALVPRQKLRCETPRYDPGGGGINVSRAMKELGGESLAFLALGGATGRQMEQLLQENDIDCEVWQATGETRISFKVVDRSSNQQFRFVLPGPHQSDDAANDIRTALNGLVRRGDYRFIVASGSLPPGLPEDFYANLAADMRKLDAHFILDTSGTPLKAALRDRPFLIKPDEQEAQSLLGDERITEKSGAVLTQKLIQQRAAEVVILTLGSEGAVVGNQDSLFRISPPEVTVSSTVGAGDSFMGALTLGLAREWSLEDACRYGVAAAASAVTTAATALCDRAQTEKFFEAVTIECLD